MKEQQASKIPPMEQIRKQHQELESLLKEQEECMRDLVAYDSLHFQQQQSEDSQRLHALLEQSLALDKELEAEKQRQRKSRQQEAPARQSSAEAAASSRPASQPRNTQRAIRTLERKLEIASTQFSEELTKNNHLRQDIQVLHGERVHFLQLHNRLQKELLAVRKKIGEMTMLSNSACDARMSAQSKMNALREEAAKALAHGDDEMKKLERILAQKRHLNKFMSTKQSERSGHDEGQGTGQRQAAEPREPRRLDAGGALLDTLEENIQATVSGDNLEPQSSSAVQVEDRNSTLVSFVVEQIKECKAVEDEISMFQAEIKRLQEENLQMERDPDLLSKDAEEMERVLSLDEQYEREANAVSDVLQQIKTVVTNILTKLNCDCSKIENKLDSMMGINDNNMVAYLGLIEEKTNELCISLAVQASKDEDSEYNPNDLANALLGHNPDVAKPDVAKAALQGMQQDADWSPAPAAEERPYSTSELRERIMKHVLQTTARSPKTSQQPGSRHGSLVENLL